MSSASVPAPPAVNHRGEAETAVRGAEALWRVPPSHFVSPHPHLVKVPLSLCLTFYTLLHLIFLVQRAHKSHFIHLQFLQRAQLGFRRTESSETKGQEVTLLLCSLRVTLLN